MKGDKPGGRETKGERERERERNRGKEKGVKEREAVSID